MTRVKLSVGRIPMLLQVKLEPGLGFEHMGLRFPAQHTVQLKSRIDTCQRLIFTRVVIVERERTGERELTAAQGPHVWREHVLVAI